MSAPFAGVPDIPAGEGPAPARADIDRELASLDRPRKHYQRYYTTRPADDDMRNCAQGLPRLPPRLLSRQERGLAGQRTVPSGRVDGRRAGQDADVLHHGYRPDHGGNGRPDMPSADHIARCQWLPDEELAVYTEEFGRTGFQGGLQWYRCALAPSVQSELLLFAGRPIEVPACFIAGARDWGVHQSPGALENMQRPSARTFAACTWSRGPGTGSNKNAAKRWPPPSLISSALDVLGPVRSPSGPV